MKEAFKKIKAFFRRLPSAPFYWWFILIAVVCAVLYFVLEIASRGTLTNTVIHIFSHPFVFLTNYGIIIFSFMPSLFIKRRLPYTFVVTILWLVLGISNGIVLIYRANPLSAIDFLVIKSMFNMATIYFTVLQLILIVIGVVAVITATVFMTIKCPRFSVNYKYAAISTAFVLLSLTVLSVYVVDADMTVYEAGQLELAYSDYGFSYCFLKSLVSQGVDRPIDYDPAAADEMVESLSTETHEYVDVSEITKGTHILPNIIVVQLESFMDISQIKGIKITSDPTPNFTRLKNEGISGYLRVPHVGGGTANIEFEVLTGMNLDHFGFGEFPFTTVLKSTACESLAFNMKTLGYTAHAMHNHIASFYDRDLAYASLGFDTFTPIEMMFDVTKNPLGWAKDEVMTSEIVSALDSTESPDVVFAVGVQGHGKYPEEPIDTAVGGFVVDSELRTESNADFGISGIADSSILGQFEYYISQINEIDIFIGEIIDSLEKRGEPYVAVFYGDHLPALPIDESDLKSGDLYKSEYAIASNITLGNLAEGEDPNTLDLDIESTHLSAYIQMLCGFSVGSITALHQYELEAGEDKSALLEKLEYKQLYDKSESEYTRTNIRFGTRTLSVDSCVPNGNALEIRGVGFTEYTEVKVGGMRYETTLVDSNTIRVENVFFDYTPLEVEWVSSSGKVLASVIYGE